jgi:hypothetical protein
MLGVETPFWPLISFIPRSSAIIRIIFGRSRLILATVLAFLFSKFHTTSENS